MVQDGSPTPRGFERSPSLDLTTLTARAEFNAPSRLPNPVRSCGQTTGLDTSTLVSMDSSQVDTQKYGELASLRYARVPEFKSAALPPLKPALPIPSPAKASLSSESADIIIVEPIPKPVDEESSQWNGPPDRGVVLDGYQKHDLVAERERERAEVNRLVDDSQNRPVAKASRTKPYVLAPASATAQVRKASTQASGGENIAPGKKGFASRQLDALRQRKKEVEENERQDEAERERIRGREQRERNAELRAERVQAEHVRVFEARLRFAQEAKDYHSEMVRVSWRRDTATWNKIGQDLDRLLKECDYRFPCPL
ncbi:hypothetical protein P7C70_g2723, partial [Phenoliferia sp. Uapishka_3]